MILGIDHIALSVNDTDQAKRKLEALGFSSLFVEFNISNDVAKKHLLKEYRANHDVGIFLSKKEGVSVEIVNHGLTVDTDAPYSYHDNYIELETADVNSEKTFWKSIFRFQETAQDTLVFKSPVRRWSCTIKLRETKLLKQYTLDSRGYTCLAFLTNNLAEDVSAAEKGGASDILTPFSLTVNKQLLNITMLRTPGGAICELIKIIK